MSCPTFVARTFRSPVLFIVDPMTSSPTLLSRGRLSPVIIDSSRAEPPSTTTPSTGTRSPGLTTNTSSTRTSSIGISTSLPSRRTLAIVGWSSSSFRTDSEARCLVRCSRRFPVSISVMMIADVSKYVPLLGKNAGKNVTITLYAHAADVPIAMSKSMFPTRDRRAS